MVLLMGGKLAGNVADRVKWSKFKPNRFVDATHSTAIIQKIVCKDVVGNSFAVIIAQHVAGDL